MYLSQLKINEKGKILLILAEPNITKRLNDIGIMEGEMIKVVRIAPLGCPMEIEINNF